MKCEKYIHCRLKELKEIKPKTKKRSKYELEELRIPISNYYDGNKFWTMLLGVKFEWE